MSENLRIAIIQDALPYWGGAEKLLAAALQVFPNASIYTLIYNREAFQGTPFRDRQIRVSALDRLPGAHRRHQAYFPLMPLAIQGFNLSSYEVILSFSYAVAHAVPTQSYQLHISYIHTPLRYAWRAQLFPRIPSGYQQLAAWAAKPYLSLFRLWDRAMISRSDALVTNSHWMATRIQEIYHRPARVLYPPVDIDRFHPSPRRAPYYIFVGRLVAHKRVDLVVKAFTRLQLPLVIIGTGPEEQRLKEMAGSNIRFLGWQPDESVAAFLGKARAFVHAGEEDFGISMAEAQAAGCPVIGLKRGGASEIVDDPRSGLLFDEQSETGVCQAVEYFEQHGVSDTPEEIHAQVRRFDRGYFQEGLETLVNEQWAAFRDRPVSKAQWTSSTSATQTTPNRTERTNGFGA